MRGVFCSQCAEKEGQMELLQKQLYEAKQRIEKLESENEALIMDVAFYGGTMINLSCNNK
jgi:hypothetical protein